MEIEGIGGNINSVVGAMDRSLADSNNPAKASQVDFGEVLSEAISDVDALQKESETLNAQLAIGEIDNLHDVVIAAEKAELALNLTLEVRNRLVEAYQEIMQMQI